MKLVIDATWDGEGFYEVNTITVHTKEASLQFMSKEKLLEWVEFTLENFMAGDEESKLEVLQMAPQSINGGEVIGRLTLVNRQPVETLPREDGAKECYFELRNWLGQTFVIKGSVNWYETLESTGGTVLAWSEEAEHCQCKGGGK